jgi:16S rRNA (guanine966-N2)-methyltransferase
MRVIAGSAGGLNLHPPGKQTRPTMDRVKGAIFSSLGDLVPEARILDLFAGSGALGVEALSRGATSATFVEFHGPTAGVIRKNLALTKLSGSVQQLDVFRFLDLYVGEVPFDLIFADPPYLKRPQPGIEKENLAEQLLSNPKLPNALSESGLLILECERRQALPSLAAWEIRSDRNYGESRILILAMPS